MRFADNNLCLVKTLEIYLLKTNSIRAEGHNSLFVSCRKPHHAVSAATIGRWLKEVLSAAGVDTEMFSAHSTRSASTTAAKTQGVSIKDIMGMAGWSRQSTFETYYHKPASSDYSEAVLCGKKGIALNNTLSFMQPCHDVELIISQGSLDLM